MSERIKAIAEVLDARKADVYITTLQESVQNDQDKQDPSELIIGASNVGSVLAVENASTHSSMLNVDCDMSSLTACAPFPLDDAPGAWENNDEGKQNLALLSRICLPMIFDRQDSPAEPSLRRGSAQVERNI